MRYFFNTKREISYLQAATSCSIYYINTNEIPNHFTLIVFWCELRDLSCSLSNGDIFTCEDNMLFSHVKISCFHAKTHLVFHRCLNNKYIYTKTVDSVFRALWLASQSENILHNSLIHLQFLRARRLLPDRSLTVPLDKRNAGSRGEIALRDLEFVVVVVCLFPFLIYSFSFIVLIVHSSRSIS